MFSILSILWKWTLCGLKNTKSEESEYKILTGCSVHTNIDLPTTMANIGITRGAVANEMGQGEEDISFVCQRCLQPLRINPSFYSMNEHTLADLSLPMSPAPEINLESGAY